MKNMKTVNVVSAIIIQNNKVFAAQRGYGEYKGKWEFPGGKIKRQETPKAALEREIIEELDTKIEVGELFETVEYDYPNFHLLGSRLLHYLGWFLPGRSYADASVKKMNKRNRTIMRKFILLNWI